MSQTYSPEYNLFQYLKTIHPSIPFVVNGYGPRSPDTCIKINLSSGLPAHWYRRNDWSIQLLSRSDKLVISKTIIQEVYNSIENRFGLQLPEYTLGSLVFPTVKAYRIVPIQTPGYIGADENGREMFSFNITLTTT